MDCGRPASSGVCRAPWPPFNEEEEDEEGARTGEAWVVTPRGLNAMVNGPMLTRPLTSKQDRSRPPLT